MTKPGETGNHGCFSTFISPVDADYRFQKLSFPCHRLGLGDLLVGREQFGNLIGFVTTGTDFRFREGVFNHPHMRDFLLDNPFIALMATIAVVLHGLVLQVPRIGLCIVLRRDRVPAVMAFEA